jgi:hypothetical protein
VKKFSKKLIVATAAVLVLSNGANVAFADDAASPTTSVPKAAKAKNSEYATALAEYRAEVKEYIEARKAIFKAFADATKAANAARKSAREAATTDQAKKDAMTAFQSAISAAASARVAALAALGNPPTKPTR